VCDAFLGMDPEIMKNFRVAAVAEMTDEDGLFCLGSRL
jgi:hypothetical protein